MSKSIKLSNGHTVYFKEHLTRKAYKDIQKRFWGENANIQGAKIENATMNIMNITEAEDYTVYVMIDKIEDAENKSVVPTLNYVEELSTTDYNAMREAVEEITGTKNEEEKKDLGQE